MNSPASPLLRRPNGRPQACEPCRKRKVACDHTQPVCHRCRKRRQTRDCVYLPMGTGVRTTAPLSPARSGSAPSVSRGNAASTDAIETVETRNPTDPRQTSPGYLGFTSFSAVYAETQISLNRLQGSCHATPEELPPEDLGREDTSASDHFTLDARTRDACLFVLRNVPEPARGTCFVRSMCDEDWFCYFLNRVLQSFYEAFGHYLGPRRNDQALEKLAVTLSRNSTLPFNDADDILPDKWLAQFSGPRTRWETLGLLFGIWDFRRKDDNAAPQQSRVREESGRASLIAKKCIDLCLELCHEFSPANSMLLFLSHKRLILETVLYGDMGRKSWLFLGEVVSLLTFLGYHVLPDTIPYEPTFMIEMKRRVYYHIYNTHMTLISLTGRPPLIHLNYNTVPLPSDIADSVLFGDRDNLRLRVRTDIGPTGWDKNARKFPVTSMRARAQIALIREKIMDCALNTKRHASIEELLELKTIESNAMKELPIFMNYKDDDIDDLKQEHETLYWKLLIRLEHLLNVFFIERLLMKRGYQQSELLSVSFDIVKYTLVFWTHQDTLMPLRGDCEWLIMAFGVPAGGILCQELLMSTPCGDAQVTRSCIIQKLSLLVGFLDWIKPTAPNGEQCGKCKIIIKHVLDQALNGPTVTAVVAGSAMAPGFSSEPGEYSGAPGANAGLATSFDWGDFGPQVDIDFDLLDTFDWTRT